MGNKSVIVAPGFYIFLAMCLLLLPIQWLLAVVFAAAFHEACHLAAIYALTGKSAFLRLNPYGAKIDLPYMSRGKEAVCALAGPVGSLLLLLLVRWMPRVALCAVMQSAVNLLPIYPLDGGRALQSLLHHSCPPPLTVRLCGCIAGICRILLGLLGFYGTFVLHLGLFPVLMAALLLIRAK